MKQAPYVAGLIVAFIIGAMFARSSLSNNIRFLHNEPSPAVVCEPPQ